MITIDRALQLVKEKVPESTPHLVYVYSPTELLIDAPAVENDTDYSAPFYVVDRNTSKVKRINPMEKSDLFFSAVSKEPVWSNDMSSYLIHHTERVYSHLVRDLGIEDTKEGREYVLDHFLSGLYDD